MLAAKLEAQKMIQQLPDDCSIEDIQYHLYVIEKVQKGLERAQKGEKTAHHRAKERMQKWLLS